ncbi:MAG: DUF5715 family protein, partial [Nanoarchaeota archaeon]
ITKIHVSHLYSIAHLNKSRDPKVKKILEDIQNYGNLEQKQRNIIHELLSVLFYLQKIIVSNQEQLTIFRKKELNSLSRNNLLRWIKEEINFITQLISLFKKEIDEEHTVSRDAITFFKRLSDDNIPGLRGIEKKSLVMGELVIRHKSTIAKNTASDLPMISIAERMGAKLISDGSSALYMLARLGKQWDIIDEKNIVLRGNINPVVLMPIKRLIDHIGKLWKREFEKQFPRKKFFPICISSLNRTIEEQNRIRLTNPHAVEPEKSAHVRGIAFDISTNGMIAEYHKLNNIIPSRSIKRRVGDKWIVQNIRRTITNILIRLKDKVNGEPIINFYLETNGCYHVVINTEKEAMRLLLAKLS